MLSSKNHQWLIAQWVLYNDNSGAITKNAPSTTSAEPFGVISRRLNFDAFDLVKRRIGFFLFLRILVICIHSLPKFRVSSDSIIWFIWIFFNQSNDSVLKKSFFWLFVKKILDTMKIELSKFISCHVFLFIKNKVNEFYCDTTLNQAVIQYYLTSLKNVTLRNRLFIHRRQIYF